MNRTSDMKKRLPGIILITGGIVLVAMVIQAVILSFINNRSFDRTSQVLLDQVSNVIEKNKASEEDYTEKQDLKNNSRTRILDMTEKLEKVKNGDYNAK